MTIKIVINTIYYLAMRKAMPDRIPAAHHGLDSLYTILSRLGGGRGPAYYERLVARVADNVWRGYITPEGARNSYGVAIDPKTFAVNEAEGNLAVTRIRLSDSDMTPA